MIPSLVLSLTTWASAQQPPEGDEAQPAEIQPAETEPAAAEPEDPLSRHRMRFDALADRAIGTTSRPVEFDWRRSPVHLAANGSFLFELNNFDSVRGGALVRLPSGGVLLEFGLAYVGVWDTRSSRMLALTPYRQAGRPERLELDFTVGLPLAEGVVTPAPRFIPAVQMVFNGYIGLRYLIHPTGFAHMRPGQLASALFAPALTDLEIDNLDDARLAAMQVDPGRYGLMLGFGDDLYFKPGLFLSPRVLFAVPLLAPASQTELLFWADISMAIGVAL